MKKMSVGEFRKLGLLQEVNRQFLHPLGLALEVVIGEDGSERFGEVWDCREDPEGVVFDDSLISPDKARYVHSIREAKTSVREGKFGSCIQPINGFPQ